ncbi:TetR/AcrR family transcriptional regulator [Cryptosporangium aurantiacum]|uniref:Transcriptional regulator, TetR family n=1 Tax=Cryptosporangium aurantiacum TaxID=134849 RepID=A0A1M7JP33_9ACTN|nr:TetR/AcrR family transcriptional regulator [Cryptosporangium aurantiacum]SHM54850.1 transcriptional regulator, TetR family [Cryptosporangium aurantiacum]
MNPGLRLRKKQQTRAALADAALRLVAERGLDHVTVEEISAAADVSARTFFNYFATKDDAVFGTMLEGSDRIREALVAAPPDRPLWDALWTAYRDEAEDLQADAERLRLRMTVCSQNPSMLARLVEVGAAAELALAEAIAARLGVEPGSDGTPLLIAVTAGGALRVAMMRWATGSGDRLLTELVDEAFEALAAGFAGR